MKIVFVANRFPPNVVGGAELTVATLALELRRRGHDVIIVSLSDEPVDTVDVTEGLTVHRLKVRNIAHPFVGQQRRGLLRKSLYHALDAHNPFMGRSVSKVLEQVRPDVVSTHNLGGFSPAVWTACAWLGIPVVHVLHDYYLTCPRTTRLKDTLVCQKTCVACRVLSVPKRWQTRNVSAVVGVSRYVLAKHKQFGFFVDHPPRVINNARALIQTKLADARSGGRTNPRIGFIGRVERPKGIEVLLDAIGRLERPDVEVLVAGSGEQVYIRSLQERYRLPQVNYLGRVSPGEF